MQVSLTYPLLVGIGQLLDNDFNPGPTASLFPGAEVYFVNESLLRPGNLQVVTIDPARVKFSRQQTEGEKFFVVCGRDDGPKIMFNGNLFAADGTALGLQISGGKKLSPLNRNSALVTGVFYVTKEGKAKIIHRDSFPALDPATLDFAMQGGPLIIEPGRKKGISSQSTKPRSRTVIALEKSGKVLILTFSYWISLRDIQELIMKNFPNITAALNLDGGGSTASCIRAERQLGAKQQADNVVSPRDELHFVIEVRPKP